jgi:hypothetical protein
VVRDIVRSHSRRQSRANAAIWETTQPLPFSRCVSSTFSFRGRLSMHHDRGCCAHYRRLGFHHEHPPVIYPSMSGPARPEPSDCSRSSASTMNSDCVTHHVHIFGINGDSYRFKQSIQEGIPHLLTRLTRSSRQALSAQRPHFRFVPRPHRVARNRHLPEFDSRKMLRKPMPQKG